jgi:ABC-type multidrug transport system ATPase subunit
MSAAAQPSAEAYLAFLTGPLSGVIVHVTRPAVTIGRSIGNDIVLMDPKVSRTHARLSWSDGAWQIARLSQTSAVTVDQSDIEQAVLSHNGTVGLGDDTTFRFLLTLDGTLTEAASAALPVAASAVGVAAGSVDPAQGPAGTVLAALSPLDIPPQALPARMQQVPLGAGEVSIGRVRDNALVLDHPQVSAHHARLVREQNTYRLTDLGSTNHTYVNGVRASSQLLQAGDEIRIGPFKLVYQDNLLTLYDESGGIRIDAVNLTQVGNQGAILLNDISLSIPPRSFVALVGSSGAGKSTLLDALSGIRPARKGSVFYNGQDFYTQRAVFSAQMGYVPQDEIIHRDLTVERALYYAAKLRLPDDFSETQIEQRIDEVLDEVDMRHRRKLLIRQLSGGQRKRVSIALELLANPSVFFLDEPTSGLDPGLDNRMMLLLRKLADKGHTIVLVTHATTNINVCDAVCFLAQGGHLVYFGPPEGASAYFEQPGFAEIYSAVEPTGADPERPSEAGERFARSPEYRQYVGEPLSHRPLPAAISDQRGQQSGAFLKPVWRGRAWKQFILLSRRYLELLWNDKKNLAILLFQAPVIALMLFIFIHELGDANIFKTPATPLAQGDAQKFLFVMAFSAVMFGCINASREIVKELAVYRRERTVNLGILPYLFSKIAVLGTLCLLQCIALLLIVNWAAPFHSGVFLPPFWEAYVALALTSLVGLMLGLTISALVPNNDQAMSFIPLVLIPQVIFSGAIFPLKEWYLQALGVVFVARWAMAALGSSVHLDSAVLGGDKLWGMCSSCATYHHDKPYLLTTWGVLLGMLILLTVLTGYLLKRKDALR